MAGGGDDADASVGSTLRATATEAETRQRPRDSNLILVVGTRIGGRYDIRGYLGEGGMGAVYRAYDDVLGEEVALKVVRGAYATAAELREEVRMATKVSHPNVCRIYDLEDIGGQHFVKMEYIAGETLAARIERGGRLPIADVLRIARAIVDGLAAAHTRGVVHRDLKPANVMLAAAPDGERVVLMDFGLARLVESASDRSGTPAYMAPEQLRGKGVDQRADLFALGCCIYEMLVGELAFGGGAKRSEAFGNAGNFTELANQRVNEPPPPVRTRRPDIPRHVAQAVEDLLSHDPARRPAGVQRLLGPKSSRVRTIALVGGAVAIGATVAIVAGRAGRDATPAWEPEVHRLGPVFDGEVVRRMSISPDGTRIAYASDRAGTGTFVPFELSITAPSAKPQPLATRVGGIRDVRYRRDGDGWLFSIVERDQPNRIVWQRRDGTVHQIGPGTDPDDCNGAIVAILDPTYDNARGGIGKQLVVYEGGPPAWQRRVIVEGAYELDHPRCDPAGRRVVYTRAATIAGTSGSHLFLADVGSAGSETELPSAGHSYTPTFTPTGSIIYSDGGAITELELPSKRTHQLTRDEPHFAPEVSRDGKLLVFNHEIISDALFVGTAASAGEPVEPARRLPTPQQDLTRIRFTPDSDHAVVQVHEVPSHRDTIARIALADGDQVELAEGFSPFPSRDGSSVYFALGSDPRELHAVPFAGGPSRKIATLRTPIWDGFDAADGQHVELRARADAGNAPSFEGWHVDDRGTAKREGDALVMPAPRGPWRATFARDRLRFERAGAPPVEPDCFGVPTWLDDHTVACQHDEYSIVVYDLAAQRPLREVTLPWPASLIVLAPDGKRWLATRQVRPTVRHAIRHFGDRPWAR